MASNQPTNLISVILPNYNHGRYIRRAVDAILNQKNALCEIIIVDDASTDNSLAEIDRIAAGAPNIRVIKNSKNEGVVAAQLRALAVATGQYVHLAAADDTILPGFYQLAIETLTRFPEAGLFAGDSLLFDGITHRFLSIRPIVMPSFKPTCLTPARVLKLLAQSDNWILTGSSLIRRDALNECGSLINELGSFADGYLTRKIALTRGYCYAPQPVSTWTIFPTGVSRSTALDVQKATALRERALALMAADSAFPEWYRARFADRWRFATARLALHREPIDASPVIAHGAKNWADQTAINLALKLSKGSLGRLASAAWLFLRLRPYRLRDLLTTYLFRRIFQATPPN